MKDKTFIEKVKKILSLFLSPILLQYRSTLNNIFETYGEFNGVVTIYRGIS